MKKMHLLVLSVFFVMMNVSGMDEGSGADKQPKIQHYSVEKNIAYSKYRRKQDHKNRDNFQRKKADQRTKKGYQRVGDK